MVIHDTQRLAITRRGQNALHEIVAIPAKHPGHTQDQMPTQTGTIYVLGFEKAEYPPISIKSIPSGDYKK